MGLITVQSPTTPAVSLTEAREHLRVDSTNDDAAIMRYVAAATDFIARETRIAIGLTSYTHTLDSFPRERSITLPRPPLAAVASIIYRDATGADQTFASTNYAVDANSQPGRVVLKDGKSWPTSNGDAANVRIAYTAGIVDVPPLLKQAVLLMLGHFYENREAAIDRTVSVVPLAVESICNQFAHLEAV